MNLRGGWIAQTDKMSVLGREGGGSQPGVRLTGRGGALDDAAIEIGSH